MHEVPIPDWRKMLNELHAAGYSNVELGRLVFLSKNHVAHVRYGHRTARPCWLVGSLIIDLYRQTFKNRPIPERQITYLEHIGNRLKKPPINR